MGLWAGVARFLGRRAVAVALVMAVLALMAQYGPAGRRAIAEARAASARLDTLRAARPAFDAHLAEAGRAAEAEAVAIGAAGAGELDRIERGLLARRAEARGRLLSPAELAAALATGRTDRVAAHHRAALVDLPLVDRALALAAARRGGLARARRAFDLDARIAEHNRLAARQRALVAEVARARAAAAAQFRNPLCRAVLLPVGCERTRLLRAKRDELARVNAGLAARRAAIERARAALAAGRVASARAEEAGVLLARARRGFDGEIAAAAQGWPSTVDRVARMFWPAVGIVMSATLLPLAGRWALFRLVAPAAARRRPVRLRPSSGADAGEAGRVSAPSIEVAIGPGDELLLRGGIASASTRSAKDDVALFDPRRPLTSVAAGLYGLQRLRADEPDRVVVSASGPLGEVALVRVADGGAMVVRPRALVGVLHPSGARPRLERRWMVRRLSAWLTGRLRVILVPGPCLLLLEGARGVRAERAEGGRAVDRAATLAFDASLAHSVARTETFRPYLLGRRSLFLDRFEGGGPFFYEEAAAGPRARGRLRGGLAGLGDAALKLFGV